MARRISYLFLNTKNSEFSKKALTSTFNNAIINTITVKINNEKEGTQ